MEAVKTYSDPSYIFSGVKTQTPEFTSLHSERERERERHTQTERDVQRNSALLHSKYERSTDLLNEAGKQNTIEVVLGAYLFHSLTRVCTLYVLLRLQ